MMNMLIGRPSTVRPISTTRTRSLAASSAAVYAYSFTSLVNVAAFVLLPLRPQVLPGVPGSPNSGCVVPVTGAEYGCDSVPMRARTRHWKPSPGLNPASAKCRLVLVDLAVRAPDAHHDACPERRAGRRALDLVVRGSGDRVPAQRGEPVVLPDLEPRDLLGVRRRRRQQGHARGCQHGSEARSRSHDNPLPWIGTPAPVVQGGATASRGAE